MAFSSTTYQQHSQIFEARGHGDHLHVEVYHEPSRVVLMRQGATHSGTRVGSPTSSTACNKAQSLLTSLAQQVEALATTVQGLHNPRQWDKNCLKSRLLLPLLPMAVADLREGDHLTNGLPIICGPLPRHESHRSLQAITVFSPSNHSPITVSHAVPLEPREIGIVT